MVDTPYVLEATEDDIYSLEFIQQAINYLRQSIHNRSKSKIYSWRIDFGSWW